MKKRFFITATGTDAGKSFITAGLVRQARARNLSVAAYKPLISGFDPLNPHVSDTGILLRSFGQAVTPKNIERISPWRYAAPLAPSMAARLENTVVDYDAVVAFSRYALSGPEDVVMIEGVGGAMVPLTDTKTVLDWTEALRTPTLMVAGTYLGSLSHTLTALEVVQKRQIPLQAVIVNESAAATVTLDQTIDELRRFTKIPLIGVKRRDTPEAPLEELAPLLD